MKLKKIISENSLSPEQKSTFIEAVSKFNEFGKSIYRENGIGNGRFTTKTRISL